MGQGEKDMWQGEKDMWSGAPFGGLVGRIMAPGWAKMPLCWPTWRQDVPQMANLEPKIGNLGFFGSILVTFLGSWAPSC